MAYTSGGLIQAIDYNYFTWGGNTTGTYSGTINNLALVFGSGFGYKGYGQDVSLISALTVGTTVSATQWAGLVYTLNRALGHQGGAGSQLASGSNIGITAGATITAFANVATAIGSINANANIAATNGTTVTGTNFATNIVGGTGTFEGNFSRTVTFASADQARYFFNAGGYLTWVVGNVINNNSTLRSADLVTQFATYQASGSVKNGTSIARTGTGGSANVTNNSLGYWQCTTSLQELTKVTSANYRYEYNNDFTNVRVKSSGVTGVNGDNGAIVTFNFAYYMFSTFVGANDEVNVTVNHRIDIVPPETTYFANTWGVIGIT
jgi:hypothetical protein